MSEYKILFLDIDGTVLRPDDTIEESTKDAISQVQAKGIEVFLATGRPLHELQEIINTLKVQSSIGYNGAFGLYKGVVLFNEPMKPETIRQFLKVAEQNQHEAVLYTKDQNLYTHMNNPLTKEFIEWFHLHHNEVYSPAFENEILGLTLINLEEKEVNLYKNEDGVHLSQVNVEGLYHCYDVIRDTVNKGIGIEHVLKHLGIRKEHSIAFGDGMNDKEMLMSVGTGFAMGNGHPDLFQYATHKTTSVTESGIYNGLKKLNIIN
ncbi:MAG: HAD family hydrolase [Neobacillus sp.]|jgi:Cof subfamily protein (haloacid dehalogenase superfamily)